MEPKDDEKSTDPEGKERKENEHKDEKKLEKVKFVDMTGKKGRPKSIIIGLG